MTSDTDEIDRAKALHQSGKLDEAEAGYQAVLTREPQHPDALHYLGLVAYQRGQFDQAADLISQSLSVDPANPKSQSNMGLSLYALRRFEEALPYFDRAIELDTDHDKAYLNKGFVLVELGQWFGAELSLRRAIELNPNVAAAHFFLGRALREQSRLSAAEASYRAAVTLQPVFPEAYANLGNVLRMQGDHEGSMAAYQEALRQNPNLNDARTKLLMGMNYVSGMTQEEIEGVCAAWNAIARADVAQDREFMNEPDPERPLRVGFVSPDFRTHSVSYFFEPLLRALDRNRVSAFCYGEIDKPDEMTACLKQLSDHWRDTSDLSDEELDEMITKDQIDVLIDLAGHTQGNRLPVFARRPAPVQATWLGYPNTTGVETIDYRLVDEITDPQNSGTEALIRMPNGFLCYQPPDDAPVPSPIRDDPKLAFGSFNNAAKLSDECIDLWSALLERAPDSTLLLKSTYLSDETTAERLRRRFAKRGVDVARLRLVGRTAAKADHLAMYAELDVCLDPIPYNGTTTTFEALWMGLPVVSLLGEYHRGRVGASILSRAGLSDMVATTAESYIETAISLANDRQRRAQLRSTMRENLVPLCDADQFARDMEQVLREMWQAWCEKQSGDGSRPSG